MNNNNNNQNFSFNNIYDSLNNNTNNQELFTDNSNVFNNNMNNLNAINTNETVKSPQIEQTPEPIQNTPSQPIPNSMPQEVFLPQNNNPNEINININSNINENQNSINNNQNTYNNKENFINSNNNTIKEPTVFVPTSIDQAPQNNGSIVPNNIEYNQDRINEIKQKSNNSEDFIYTDGLDTIEEDKKGIKNILTNKKFILCIAILAFICVCVVVTKAFYFGMKIDTYEETFIEIEKKEEEAARVYESKEIDSAILKKVAATELISCINSKIDTNKLPESVTNVINKINNYYNQSNNYFAFSYKDIYTGFTVSYNENQNIFTASAIKGPTDIYIYEMASQGKVNLDEELTYTANYYNNGSGLLKNKPVNTKYSVRTLLEYSTVWTAMVEKIC